MEETLDQNFLQPDRSNVSYGGFWQRLGARFIDGLILAPISFGVVYFNITSWKSIPVLLLITIITTAYKPFMEFSYGATLGKMALNLKVTNLEFGPPSLGEALLRNIFYIGQQAVALFFGIIMYSHADFESVTGYWEFATFSQQFVAMTFFNYAFGIVGIVDVVMLISDHQKRSLHDRIGGTYVIES